MLTKVQRVKAMVFPVVMYGCENWTIKKAKCQRSDAFKLWYWRRLLKSPVDCKDIKPVNSKGNQPWIFIGRIDAEGPILWPFDAKSWLIGKDPNAGKDWRQKEKREQIIRWLDGITNTSDVSLSKQTPGDSEDRGAWCDTLHGVAKSETWPNKWTRIVPDRLHWTEIHFYSYVKYILIITEE